MTIRSLPALSPLTLAVQAFLLVGSVSLSAASYAATAPAAPTGNVSWEDIANDHLTTKDVLQYGMGTNAQRWSPLAQVNDKNVFKLTPAWSYSFGDEKQRGQESQAIVSDGVVLRHRFLLAGICPGRQDRQAPVDL